MASESAVWAVEGANDALLIAAGKAAIKRHAGGQRTRRTVSVVGPWMSSKWSFCGVRLSVTLTVRFRLSASAMRRLPFGSSLMYAVRLALTHERVLVLVAQAPFVS